MNTEALREFCLSLPDAVEDQPWTEPQYQILETFKVGGKSHVAIISNCKNVKKR